MYCETVFYKDEDSYLEEYVRENFDVCVLRKVTGMPPSFTRSKYDMLVKRMQTHMPLYGLDANRNSAEDIIQALADQKFRTKLSYL